MKRSLAVVALLALVLAACATTTGTASTGVITQVALGDNAVTVSSNGQTMTYTLGRNTNIYSPDGVLSSRSYLAEGQRVMVWANGTNAVRINIEP